jgi:hypothetical protein
MSQMNFLKVHVVVLIVRRAIVSGPERGVVEVPLIFSNNEVTVLQVLAELPDWPCWMVS